jgi:hypothetical protein
MNPTESGEFRPLPDVEETERDKARDSQYRRQAFSWWPAAAAARNGRLTPERKAAQRR